MRDGGHKGDRSDFCLHDFAVNLEGNIRTFDMGVVVLFCNL